MMRALRDLPYLTDRLIPLLEGMSKPEPWDQRSSMMDCVDDLIEESILREMEWKKPRHISSFPFYELSGRINAKLPVELRRIRPYDID
jgi:hypothetical protein